MNERINEVLDIRDPPTELVAEVIAPENHEADFEFARTNLYDLIGKGQSALTDLSELAKSAQSARAYEVLGNYIKTMVEINERLVDLHQKKKDVEKPDGPDVVNNNLILTTAQLAEMLKDMKPKELK